MGQMGKMGSFFHASLWGPERGMEKNYQDMPRGFVQWTTKTGQPQSMNQGDFLSDIPEVAVISVLEKVVET